MLRITGFTFLLNFFKPQQEKVMVEEIKKKTDTFLQGLREDFDKAVIKLITEKETLTTGDILYRFCLLILASSFCTLRNSGFQET